LYTYLGLGLLLLAAAYFSERLAIKKHFHFSYQHYGVHLTYISLLAGYFHYDYVPSLIWLVGFGVAAWLIYKDAVARKSFYFIMLTVVYGYVALSSLLVRSLMLNKDDTVLGFGFFYFAGSGVAVVALLMNLNKKLKAHD
jgi:hypothetical protein